MARPCDYRDNSGTHLGIFLRWGQTYEYGLGDEKVPITVAIVEDYETGKVKELPPAAVTFVERPDLLTEDEGERELLHRLSESDR